MFGIVNYLSASTGKKLNAKTLKVKQDEYKIIRSWI